MVLHRRSQPELALGELGEPGFVEIDPQCRGGREMNMEARSFCQPVVDLVVAALVENRLHKWC